MRQIHNYSQRCQQYSPIIIRLSRQVIVRTSNKGMEDLNNIINQLDLSNIYKMLHPTTEYTFSSDGRLYGVA